ncbi:G2/mitotic-specific cyclin-B-like [Ornithodoros turicata]|uniref:G2/mitotic-specific cyclin-B-like n=1 Tax=Ornithodoros turicata TaxID=34597 RepID=UPI0031395058
METSIVSSSDDTSEAATFKKASLQRLKVGTRPLGTRHMNVPVLKDGQPLAQIVALPEQLFRANCWITQRESSAKPISKDNRHDSADSIPSTSKVPVEKVDTRPTEPQSYSTAVLPAEVTDIDAPDRGNVQLCSQYAKDVHKYLSELELKYPIRPNFLLGKLKITASMRSVLVHWLVQVQEHFQLLQETLYLAIAVLDRYLQVAKDVSPCNLQLIGATAMFIAAKYEETNAPDIVDYVYISKDSFTKRDMFTIEIAMLKALDFSLGLPLPLHFLRRVSKAGKVSAIVHSMAKYLLELSATDYSMAHIRPSLLAATSLWLSLQMVDGSEWTADLAYYGGYTTEEMGPFARKICQLVMSASSSSKNIICNKYKRARFGSVSIRPELGTDRLKELVARLELMP